MKTLLPIAFFLALTGCGNEEGAPLPLTAPAEARPAPSPAPAPAPVATPPPVALAPDLLARRELSLPGRPVGLVAHDFDADGFADLAVTLEQPARLALFAGGPAGLAETPTFAPLAAFPTAPQVSAGTLFVGSMATGQLTGLTLQRDAQGALVATPAREATPGGRPRLVTGDDARLLWVTRDSELVLLEARAPDTPLARRALGRDVRVVGALVHEDTVVALGQGHHEVLVLDAGDLSERRRLPFPGVPRSVDAGDLDADGDAELVVVGGDNTVWVFGLGAPGGVRTALQGEPAVLTQANLVPDSVHVHDLDPPGPATGGDGRAELVALGLIDQGYNVLTNLRLQTEGASPDGASGTRTVVASEYAGQDPVALALGDFDGNGTVDLATACRAANAISLWSGTGRATPERAPFDEARRLGVGGNPLSIAAADVLGPRTADGFGPADGRPEVATLDAGDGMLSLLANDGYGQLSLAARHPVGPSPRGLSALRMPSGSALVALSVAPGRGGELVGFRAGPVDVTVALPPGRGLPEAAEGAILATDFDRDGRTDLVLAATGLPELWLLRNTTSATELTFEARIQPLERPATAVTALGHAGRTLLALGSGHRLQLREALSGAPVLTLEAPAAVRAGRGLGRLAATDHDGDGQADLAALWLGPAGTSPGWLQVRSLPELFDQAPAIDVLVPTGLAPQGLASADLNADGRLDFLVAAQNSHLVNLFTSRAPGHVAALPSLGVGLGPMAPLAVDLIGKGLVDIVVANAFSADVSVVYNRPRAAR